MGSRNEPSEDLKWQPRITKKEAEAENASPNEELLEKIKAEKQKIKERAEQERSKQQERMLSPETYTPYVNNTFAGNLNNGGTPLDNCIAVSDAGIVLSSANTTFNVYSAAGTLIYSKSVLQTIKDPSISNVCDEYVLYDRGADRFIAFAEECSGSSLKSQLLILFSKTNNPATGGWWYYKLSGNPFVLSEWFDYPKMAVSDNELYISGNLFNNNDSYNEAGVWQIRKGDGYSGKASLTYQVWHQFAGSPFTVCPVGNGWGQAYGPGCYMVADNALGGSDIQLYQITNDIGGTPAPQINYTDISTTEYGAPANAMQLGTSQLLKINDCRMMNGFYLNGVIHFVFNSDPGNGYSGIYYGRLTLSNNTIVSGFYYNRYLDYAYPNITSFATSVLDKSVMIGYGVSGSGNYPAMGVINCDDQFYWSDPVTVKTSAAYIDDGNGTAISRWGDFTGSTRLNSATAPTIWMSGSYSTLSNYWDSWIAKITGVDEVIHEAIVDTKVFPNPISNLFQLQFILPEAGNVQIDIYDMSGRLVKQLYNGAAYEGTNLLSFNRDNLDRGVYVLVVRTDSGTLTNQKIVITG
jgi:hypothetical protein